MKLSLYNSEITIEGKHTLLFNSFTGKFVAIKNKLQSLKGLDLVSLAESSPVLYGQLSEAGMIVEHSTDELALLNERIAEADNNSSEFILHINPTLDCNFKCWYCYENHVANSKMDAATVAAVCRFIDKTLENPTIKSFDIGFFGGEPLYHFKDVAKKIIEHAAEICREKEVSLHTHFTSNGALLTDAAISFLSTYDCGFQITLDGGRQDNDATRFFANKAGSFDRIVRNVKKLVENNINVIVRVNYTSKNINSVKSIPEFFCELTQEQMNHLSFDFQRVWQDRDERNDSTEAEISVMREACRQMGFRVHTNYLPQDVRHSCYGDKINHALINYNGEVFGCTARDFITPNSIGKLSADGTISYQLDKLKVRNTSKMAKAVCRQCRIAPLCGGGCKQKATEGLSHQYCSQGYSEKDIDNMIIDIFDYYFTSPKCQTKHHQLCSEK